MDNSNQLDWAWIRPCAEHIDIEIMQCHEEGKDISLITDQAAQLKSLDFTLSENVQLVGEFYDMTASLPVRDGYPYKEPSDIKGIRALSKGSDTKKTCDIDRDVLYDKAYGAWLGRIAGCMLGKPVEGRSSAQIRTYLQSQGRWPLNDYFSMRSDESVRKECGLDYDWSKMSAEGMTCAIADDDTNYTTACLAVYNTHGADFTPSNVAGFWLNNIPFLYTCTAERVAYRNLVNLVAPPESAAFRNPYREWIGAQIRADFWGYVCPGDPARAAEYAWRDACISHVKNGIYGEMWTAAILAAAYETSDIETIIRAGLAQIPGTSRLHESIERVIRQYHDGLSYECAIADMHSRWDEAHPHGWCHTISNAIIVTIALLWGAGDFTRTICNAVMAGFDTDCNGATAGSILGLIVGAKNLPDNWVRPLNDTLHTGVAGYHCVKISEIAGRTAALASHS
ncbi:ADP-ribosylglycohydrolase family protein [bacterium]|nr:ADP-ribosylglycohydrolase family protein [bacterium]